MNFTISSSPPSPPLPPCEYKIPIYIIESSKIVSFTVAYCAAQALKKLKENHCKTTLLCNRVVMSLTATFHFCYYTLFFISIIEQTVVNSPQFNSNWNLFMGSALLLHTLQTLYHGHRSLNKHFAPQTAAKKAAPPVVDILQPQDAEENASAPKEEPNAVRNRLSKAGKAALISTSLTGQAALSTLIMTLYYPANKISIYVIESLKIVSANLAFCSAKTLKKLKQNNYQQDLFYNRVVMVMTGACHLSYYSLFFASIIEQAVANTPQTNNSWSLIQGFAVVVHTAQLATHTYRAYQKHFAPHLAKKALDEPNETSRQEEETALVPTKKKKVVGKRLGKGAEAAFSSLTLVGQTILGIIIVTDSYTKKCS